jgi:CRISPR system Cascade subunit CasA
LLDPLFIEVCRRVRLDVKGGRITARRANSVAARVEAKGVKGIPGDPWAPVHASDNKPLTLSEHGNFGYATVVDLLQKWHVPALARAVSGDGDSLLVLEALARGNSKTAGHKTRAIPVPGKVKSFFNQPTAGLIAQSQIKEVEAVSRALANALALFAARGEVERRDQRRKHFYRCTEAPCARLETRADVWFFPALWDRLAAQQGGDLIGAEAAKRAFLATLCEAARTEFETALPAIPCPVIHRPRAEVRARRAFEGTLRASPHLALLFAKEEAHG